MNDLINILNTVVDDFFIINNTTELVTIDEPKNDVGCKKISILLRRKPIFAFTLDKDRNRHTNFRPFQFFNPTTASISKINDGIIFLIYNKKIIVLLIELKSESYSLSDVMIKTKSAKNFSDYLINTVNLHFKKQYKVSDIEYKAILFTSKMPNKGTSKKRKVSFTTKEDILFTRQPCNTTYQLDAFL